MSNWYYYFAGLADKLEGRVIPIDKPDCFNYTIEEPLGVIAAITPWNSPLMLATWKLAPALAAGNTIVWKPSEHSSVSALEFGKLFDEAGLPPGAVNHVCGFGHEIGEALVTHPDVATTHQWSGMIAILWLCLLCRVLIALRLRYLAPLKVGAESPSH